MPQVKKTATDEQAQSEIQVGLQKSLEDEEIQQRLVKKSSLRCWGVAGIGETTFCKVVFNGPRNVVHYTLFDDLVCCGWKLIRVRVLGLAIFTRLGIAFEATKSQVITFETKKRESDFDTGRF